MSTILDRNDAFQGDLYERKILKPYLEEYTNNTIFDRFTGGPDSAIVGKTASMGEGDTMVFTQRQNFDPTVKTGNERLLEAEDKLTYGVDRFQIGYFRFATAITNQELQELQINHKFSADVKAQLLYQGEVLNTRRIMRQFGLAFSENNRGTPNQAYSYDDLKAKMLNCGIDVANNGEVISRSRVLFGADEALTAATIDAALIDASIPVDTGALTTNHLFYLSDLAQKGSRTDVANKEHAIRPFKMGTNRMGYPEKKYMLLTSSDAYFKLLEDPTWSGQTGRGVIEHEEQPTILFGSNYKGTVHGVMVVTIPEFSNYTITKGDQKYAYSALLGSSAMALGIGQIPHFATDTLDYGMHKGIAHIEVSDAKVLKFPSKTDLTQKGVNPLKVENGMIHSFTRIK